MLKILVKNFFNTYFYIAYISYIVIFFKLIILSWILCWIIFNIFISILTLKFFFDILIFYFYLSIILIFKIFFFIKEFFFSFFFFAIFKWNIHFCFHIFIFLGGKEIFLSISPFSLYFDCFWIFFEYLNENKLKHLFLIIKKN